jgi:hypothetical protein
LILSVGKVRPLRLSGGWVGSCAVIIIYLFLTATSVSVLKITKVLAVRKCLIMMVRRETAFNYY